MQCERLSFTLRKVIFYTAKGHVLQDERTPFEIVIINELSLKTIPPTGNMDIGIYSKIELCIADIGVIGIYLESHLP